MQEIVVKWINKNAEEVRMAIISMVVINLFMLAISAMTGGLVSFFLHIFNILIADVALVIPTVYAIKFFKSIQ